MHKSKELHKSMARSGSRGRIARVTGVMCPRSGVYGAASICACRRGGADRLMNRDEKISHIATLGGEENVRLPINAGAQAIL